MKNKASFEDKIDEINAEIYKRRGKWQLRAIAWMDFDDVAQIVRIHINKKWKLWDQTRSLAPWLNRVITHQIRNLLRNLYSNFSRPCLRCSACQGETLCSIYNEQGVNCPLYRKWTKTKQSAFNVKLPVSIENNVPENTPSNHDGFDVERAAKILHEKIQEYLRPIEKKIYEALYIKHKGEEEVAEMMGYKTSEVGRKNGYKRIRQLKKSIIIKVKRYIEKHGTDINL